MSKALRLSEKWFQRGLWLVALVFASFLIGLGSTVVGDLPRVEHRLALDDFMDRAAAQAFAAFWFEEGYARWLAVNPERKVPMRWGTAAAPRRFIDAWGTQPLADSDLSLTDIYGAETVARLRDGIAAAPRWGIREGQGVLMTRLYNEFTISIVLQEMLSGYFPPTATLQEAYRRTIALIPNYAFPITLPEETTEP